MRPVRILAVCGSGTVSSAMLSSKIKDYLKEKSRKLTVHLSAFRVLLMLAIIALLSGVMACVLIERDSTLHSAAFVCSIIGLTLSIYVNRRVRSVQKHKV